MSITPSSTRLKQPAPNQKQWLLPTLFDGWQIKHFGESGVCLPEEMVFCVVAVALLLWSSWESVHVWLVVIMFSKCWGMSLFAQMHQGCYPDVTELLKPVMDDRELWKSGVVLTLWCVLSQCCTCACVCLRVYASVHMSTATPHARLKLMGFKIGSEREKSSSQSDLFKNHFFSS